VGFYDVVGMSISLVCIRPPHEHCLVHEGLAKLTKYRIQFGKEKQMQTEIETTYTQQMNLPLRLFLSLSLQQALEGLNGPYKRDEINQELDQMLVELICSACQEIFPRPIEA